MVLDHCLHDDGVKLKAYGVVVMPDHVHMVLAPLTDPRGMPYGLAELLGSIKGASAHSVNRVLARKGHLWQAESFDHMLRSSEQVCDKVDYICANPVRWGLVADPSEYEWLWQSDDL
jgi:REP element-mobilizing transposase RayT